MTRALALAAAVALTACSGGQRNEGDGVRVVEGEQRGTPSRGVVTRPTPLPRAAVATAPILPTDPSRGLEASTPVRGDFTAQHLPAELTHLNGLGGISSRAEERTP